jgi:hypothetical protein
MALTIKTNSPSDLLKAIKAAIDAKQTVTWSYDKDDDFTHTPDQWKNKAWLRPKVEVGELKFLVVAPKDVQLTKAVSGVYQGRFIEMLVTHFETKFSTITAIVP